MMNIPPIRSATPVAPPQSLRKSASLACEKAAVSSFHFALDKISRSAGSEADASSLADLRERIHPLSNSLADFLTSLVSPIAWEEMLKRTKVPLMPQAELSRYIEHLSLIIMSHLEGEDGRTFLANFIPKLYQLSDIPDEHEAHIKAYEEALKQRPRLKKLLAEIATLEKLTTTHDIPTPRKYRKNIALLKECRRKIEELRKHCDSPLQEIPGNTISHIIDLTEKELADALRKERWPIDKRKELAREFISFIFNNAAGLPPPPRIGNVVSIAKINNLIYSILEKHIFPALIKSCAQNMRTGQFPSQKELAEKIEHSTTLSHLGLTSLIGRISSLSLEFFEHNIVGESEKFLTLTHNLENRLPHASTMAHSIAKGMGTRRSKYGREISIFSDSSLSLYESALADKIQSVINAFNTQIKDNSDTIKETIYPLIKPFILRSHENLSHILLIVLDNITTKLGKEGDLFKTVITHLDDAIALTGDERHKKITSVADIILTACFPNKDNDITLPAAFKSSLEDDLLYNKIRTFLIEEALPKALEALDSTISSDHSFTPRGAPRTHPDRTIAAIAPFHMRASTLDLPIEGHLPISTKERYLFRGNNAEMLCDSMAKLAEELLSLKEPAFAATLLQSNVVHALFTDKNEPVRSLFLGALRHIFRIALDTMIQKMQTHPDLLTELIMQFFSIEHLYDDERTKSVEALSTRIVQLFFSPDECNSALPANLQKIICRKLAQTIFPLLITKAVDAIVLPPKYPNKEELRRHLDTEAHSPAIAADFIAKNVSSIAISGFVKSSLATENIPHTIASLLDSMIKDPRDMGERIVTALTNTSHRDIEGAKGRTGALIANIVNDIKVLTQTYPEIGGALLPLLKPAEHLINERLEHLLLIVFDTINREIHNRPEFLADCVKEISIISTYPQEKQQHHINLLGDSIIAACLPHLSDDIPLPLGREKIYSLITALLKKKVLPKAVAGASETGPYVKTADTLARTLFADTAAKQVAFRASEAVREAITKQGIQEILEKRIEPHRAKAQEKVSELLEKLIPKEEATRAAASIVYDTHPLIDALKKDTDIIAKQLQPHTSNITKKIDAYTSHAIRTILTNLRSHIADNPSALSDSIHTLIDISKEKSDGLRESALEKYADSIIALCLPHGAEELALPAALREGVVSATKNMLKKILSAHLVDLTVVSSAIQSEESLRASLGETALKICDGAAHFIEQYYLENETALLAKALKKNSILNNPTQLSQNENNDDPELLISRLLSVMRTQYITENPEIFLRRLAVNNVRYTMLIALNNIAKALQQDGETISCLTDDILTLNKFHDADMHADARKSVQRKILTLCFPDGAQSLPIPPALQLPLYRIMNEILAPSLLDVVCTILQLPYTSSQHSHDRTSLDDVQKRSATALGKYAAYALKNQIPELGIMVSSTLQKALPECDLKTTDTEALTATVIKKISEALGTSGGKNLSKVAEDTVEHVIAEILPTLLNNLKESIKKDPYFLAKISDSLIVAMAHHLETYHMLSKKLNIPADDISRWVFELQRKGMCHKTFSNDEDSSKKLKFEHVKPWASALMKAAFPTGVLPTLTAEMQNITYGYLEDHLLPILLVNIMDSLSHPSFMDKLIITSLKKVSAAIERAASCDMNEDDIQEDTILPESIIKADSYNDVVIIFSKMFIPKTTLLVDFISKIIDSALISLGAKKLPTYRSIKQNIGYALGNSIWDILKKDLDTLIDNIILEPTTDWIYAKIEAGIKSKEQESKEDQALHEEAKRLLANTIITPLKFSATTLWNSFALITNTILRVAHARFKNASFPLLGTTKRIRYGIPLAKALSFFTKGINIFLIRPVKKAVIFGERSFSQFITTSLDYASENIKLRGPKKNVKKTLAAQHNKAVQESMNFFQSPAHRNLFWQMGDIIFSKLSSGEPLSAAEE